MKNSKDSLKYSTKGNVEAEFEQGGRVLKNKLGICSKKEMDSLEFGALMKAQKHYYNLITPNTRFTARLIGQMHKDIFGDLYPWAGRYRTVNLEKGGFKWPPSYLVEQNMDDFEKNILVKHTPCRKGNIKRIAKDIAIVHAELLLIHPFRDGNGRLARLVANLMALQAALPPLEFGFEKRTNRLRYLKAVKQGYLQNYRPLTQFILEVMRNEKRGGNAA